MFRTSPLNISCTSTSNSSSLLKLVMVSAFLTVFVSIYIWNNGSTAHKSIKKCSHSIFVTDLRQLLKRFTDSQGEEHCYSHGKHCQRLFFSFHFLTGRGQRTRFLPGRYTLFLFLYMVISSFFFYLVFVLYFCLLCQSDRVLDTRVYL